MPSFDIPGGYVTVFMPRPSAGYVRAREDFDSSPVGAAAAASAVTAAVSPVPAAAAARRSAVFEREEARQAAVS